MPGTLQRTTNTTTHQRDNTRSFMELPWLVLQPPFCIISGITAPPAWRCECGSSVPLLLGLVCGPRKDRQHAQRSHELRTEEALRLVCSPVACTSEGCGAEAAHLDQSLTTPGEGMSVSFACTSAIGCICNIHRPSCTISAGHHRSDGVDNNRRSAIRGSSRRGGLCMVAFQAPVDHVG